MGEEFQLLYLASEIVDGIFKFFKIERKTSNVGKPPFDLKINFHEKRSLKMFKIK